MLERIDSDNVEFRTAVNKAASEIAKYTIQLFEIDSGGEYKPLATSVLVQNQKAYFLYTAAHVLETKIIYVLTDFGMVQVIGKSVRYSLKNYADTGFIHINDSLAKTLEETFKFVQYDKILIDLSITTGSSFISFGFPEKAHQKDGNINKQKANFFLHTGLVSEKIYKYYGLDPTLQYIIEHSGKGVNMKSALKEKINKAPNGMSGGGLWYLRPIRNTTNEEIFIKFFLVGILTDFRKGKYHVLIADNIRLLFDAINLASQSIL